MNERTFKWDYIISDKIVLTSTDSTEIAHPVIPMSYGYGVNNLGASCRYKKSGSSAKVGHEFLLLLSEKDVLLEMRITKHEIITLDTVDSTSWWDTKFMKRSVGEAVSIREIQLPAGTRADNGNWHSLTSQKKRDPLKPDDFESMLNMDDLREMRIRMIKLLTVLPEEDMPSSWLDHGKTGDLSRIGCEPITKFFRKIAAFVEMEILRERSKYEKMMEDNEHKDND